MDNKSLSPQKPQHDNFSVEMASFYNKASEIFESIEAILEEDRHSNKLTYNDLHELLDIANCTENLLKSPTKKHIDALNELSKTISGQGSPLWQGLGAALIAFTAIALIVAGVVGAIPTGGASLLATAAGAAVLTGTGAAGIVKGSQSDLCKSVGLFKQATEKVPGNAGENNGAEEQKRPEL